MKLSIIWVYVLVIFSMLFWGLSFVWFKIVNPFYSPITIIFLRLLISSSMLYFIIRIFRFRYKVKQKDVKYFLLLAFCQPFCYFLGESYGLTKVSSTVSAVIIATIPLFTPIVAYYFVHEKLSLFHFIGMIVSFSGIIIMIINPDLSFNASPQGIFLLFFAVASAVAFSAVIRKISPDYSPLTITFYQNLLGSVYFLPLFFIFDYQNFIYTTPSWNAIAALLQLAVFASSLAYLFYVIGLNRIGLNKASLYANLIPVFTAFFSFFILGEQFTFAKILGIAVVIVGVMISQLDKLNNRLKLRKL
ncbi:MAG: DMT family transporter [Lentimicrobiaceae bacterium]|nr:DMT family transporter [Lentimicrobiaceae bacterium]